MPELVCDFSTKSIELQNLMLTVHNLVRLAYSPNLTLDAYFTNKNL